MSILPVEQLFQPTADVYGFLRDESDRALFRPLANADNVTALKATDAKVIAEVNLPHGMIPGLELAKIGFDSSGKDYPRQYIITSPNMGWIPDLSKSLPSVRMNQDTRFGYHDFSMWPQLYFPETRHFSFTRSRPPTSELAAHPFAILWRDLTRSDFQYEPGTIFTDLGQISTNVLDQVFDFRHRLTKRIMELKTRSSPSIRDVEAAALTAATDGMRLTSVCLRTAAQSYLATCATFTLFQRHALEGLSCVEMLTVWATKARADTDEVPLDFVDPTLMGTITSSIQVAIDMATLGVPVWLVRPPHSVPSKSIKILAKEYPVRLREERASVTPIADMKAYYIGAPTYGKNRACLCLHLGHIHLGGRGEVYKEIVYVAVSSESSAPPGPSAPSGPPIPYSNEPMNDERTNTGYTINTEKYKPLNVRFGPSIIPQWKEALRNTPQDPTLILDHQDARLIRGYALMDPWLLAHNDRIGERNLVVWLFIRPAWISQITTLWAAGSHFPSSQQWRYFASSVGRRMGFDWTELSSPSSNALPVRPQKKSGKKSVKKFSKEPDNKAGKNIRGVRAHQESTESIEASLSKDFPLNLGSSISKQDLYWRGSLVLKSSEYDARPLPISDIVRGEILWDLVEQSFRVELLAVDRCVLPRASMSLAEATLRDEWVFQVFPSGSPVNTGMSEESLGARHTMFRTNYLNGFRRVIQTWGQVGDPLKEERFRNIDKSSHPTVVEELERRAFGIYCTTFFKYFGRAPTVPHIFPTSAHV